MAVSASGSGRGAAGRAGLMSWKRPRGGRVALCAARRGGPPGLRGSGALSLSTTAWPVTAP